MPSKFSNEDDQTFEKASSSADPLLTTIHLKTQKPHDAESKDYKAVVLNHESPPENNTNQLKTSLSLSLMCLVLINANMRNLRTVLDSSASHPYYYFNVISLSFSIIIQVLVGIGLILNIRNGSTNNYISYKLHYTILVGVFISTVVNLFTTSFTVNIPVESIAND